MIWAVALAALAGTPRSAMASAYTLNFTLTAGTVLPSSASFDYDGSTFSNFIIVWDGLTFDLTSTANVPDVNPNGCQNEGSTPQFAFALLEKNLVGCTITATQWMASDTVTSNTFTFIVNAPSSDTFPYSFGVASGTQAALGDWTVTPQGATPEPGTASLFAAGGLAALFCFRRRGARSRLN